MRKFLLAFASLLPLSNVFAQNLSYTCPREITLSCNTPCVTLTAQIPDLRSQADDYEITNITPISQCYPLVDPGGPGPSANLTMDDRYSAVISIPFNFNYYGVEYDELVVSANGFISFDVSLALTGAPWSLAAGNPLPHTGYPRAIIAGPWHDLDPTVTTSPTRQIKYNVDGNAPNRKFVISYYKMPLFGSSCNHLFENTHQIILHESSNIVEVFIQDKQPCAGWNSGRAFVGMQNYDRNKGILAPGRSATDAPWGSVGMNETWRFIPKAGPTLYRGVELLDATGATVATGDTVRVNSTTFEVTFPNVCPPPTGNSIYVVKTTYQSMNNFMLTYYSLDTITLIRNAPPGSATTTATSCLGASDGTVTIVPPAGIPGPVNYTLLPVNITQTDNPVFTGLPAGTYSATFTDVSGCTNSVDNIVVDPGPPLTGTASSTSTSCPGVSDGTVTATPGGTGPYTYTLNPGNVVQTTNVFTGLAAGTYNITFTTAAGCSGTIPPVTVTDGAAPTGTATATNTSCPGVNDGTITVTPSGNAPHTFTLNPGGITQASNIFTNLAPGTYTITFTTAEGCIGTVPSNPVVNAGPALTSSTVNDQPDCFGINDGSITIVPGGVAPFSFTLTGPSGSITQTDPVFTGLEPGSYSYTYSDAAGCQGTGATQLVTNLPVSTPASLNMPLCNGGNTGSVTMSPTGGVSPYEYSIDGGTTYQSSPTLTGLSAGTYTITVRDNAGCIKDTSVILGEPTLLTASATSVNSGCAGNDGQITVTGNGGTAPYQYSIDNGANWQPSNTFTANTGNYDNVLVKDANGCTASTSTVVGLTDDMFLELGPDITICEESSHTFQPQTNTGTDVFTWSSPSFTPNTLDDTTIKNATATPKVTTTYVLDATWGACNRQDQITVTVLGKPVPDAGNDVMICHLDSTVLTATATNLSGTVNYTWSPASFVRDTFNYTTMVVPGDTRMFYVTVTDNYGCNFSVTDSVLVTMQPPVPAFAGNDTIAMTGVPHRLLGSGGVNYTWSPSFYLSNPYTAQPDATITQDTKFTLVVEDIAGCIGYDTVFVKVYDGPAYYVPNAFTPNGDGLNDIFRAVPAGIATTEYFRVFNRYGQVVFETNQWLRGWDGRFQGKDQPGGVYIWIVKGKDRNGRVVEEKGTVTLIR